MNKDIFFSIDIESDGPIPGPNSMLSLGCAAFDEGGDMIGTFSRNLQTLDGAEGDDDTMAFWRDNPEAWKETRKDCVEPEKGMREFRDWVSKTCFQGKGRAVCVAFPAGFDFMFVYWYLRKHGLDSPFSFSCVDMKSVAMVKLGKSYRDCSKRNFPKEWFGPEKHTHIALDDAIEQGRMFFRMMGT